MDDSMAANLNSMIHANNAIVRFRMLTKLILTFILSFSEGGLLSQVISFLKDDSTFIQELFARLRSPSTSDDSKKDLVSIDYIYICIICIWLWVYDCMPHFALIFRWLHWPRVEICHSFFY